MISALKFIIRARWNIIRLSGAVFVVWILVVDSGARLARMTLSQLPDFDYVAEVEALRLQGRYGEAELLANAALESSEANRDAIRTKLAQVIDERNSVVRRAIDFGKGAVTGRGESLESLIGAIGTDFLVIGDVRDLVIEGGRYVIDGETDELVVLLSVAGVVTTVAPEIDWVPSVLKSARKAGYLGQKLASELSTLIRSKRAEELRDVFVQFGKLSQSTSPGSAIRILRHVDSTEDLSVFARFVGRGKAAGAALHVTGASGASFLKSVDPNDAQAFARAAEVVEQAGKKGSAGASFLKSSAARRLLRPHPLLGVSKGFIKGNAAQLIERLAERIDPWGGTLLAFGITWLVVECALLRRAFNIQRRSETCQT